MMTPEKTAPAPPGEDISFVDEGVDASADLDLENQQIMMDDSNTMDVVDAPSATASANINSTVNDSMTSENCKIINESDQQHTPVSHVSDGGANSGSINPNDMMEDVNLLLIPDSPNLTPVKLDAGLSKEQDNLVSSPTGTGETNSDDGSSDDQETRPLSRRQQRMRVYKCYGLVAVIVLICAIGIPLGAVMLFKNNDSETSFSGVTSDGATSDGNPTQPPTPPVVVEEDVVTEAPIVAEEEEADEEDDFFPLEETSVPVAIALGTDAPAADDAAVGEPWGVMTQPPAPTEANVTDPLPEMDGISDVTPAVTTEAPVPEDTTVEAETDAPTEEEAVVTTPGPTMAPATRPPGPDRSPIYFELVNVTSPAVLQDTTSPQALAYLWLVEQDQVLPIPTGRKLVQRYALVLMDHVMHEPIRPALVQAELDECEWTGIVCDETTGDVLEVNWSRQNLNGQLVEEMKHLDQMVRLDLSENELVGNLDALYETKSLKEVFLNNNKLSGTLSEQIGLVEGLEMLYLGHNELTGSIPLSLRSTRGVAKPLKWLILSHNQFTGYLPPDWRMRELFYLDLGYNYLSGPLPGDWDLNMVRLRHLYLDHNSFTGTLPGYFSQLGNGRLKQLNLNSNFLEGEVPFNWEPKDQLITLNLQDNNITTPLAASVCELSVFELGQMVEMRVDCPICTCDTLCHQCS